MATFYNQATLSFRGRLTNSNVTSGEIRDTVSISKYVLSTCYRSGERIVFVINLTNSGCSAINNATVIDNLGAFRCGSRTVYPLEYVEGSIRCFVNGVEQAAPLVNVDSTLKICEIDLAVGSNMQISYEACANEYAPVCEGGCIENVATLSNNGCDIATASARVCANCGVSLTIAKAICPTVINENGSVTYTFVIQNTGSAATVATDDVIVSDLFDPRLTDISVYFNGEEWSEGVNYTYNEATGQFATLVGQIIIPGATSEQNEETGVVTVTPGVGILTVTGNVQI